ncbi:hypothetical protein Vretifemale_18954, partial [Volvox reticuliferus]
MLKHICPCNGIFITSELAIGHVQGALRGVFQLPGLLNTISRDWSCELHSTDGIHTASHSSRADRYVPRFGSLPQNDCSGGGRSVIERPVLSLHGVWLHLTHANAISQIFCEASPWARAAAIPATRRHSPHAMFLAQSTSHQTRHMGTMRQRDHGGHDHERDGHGHDGSLSSYDRLRKHKRRADLDTDGDDPLKSVDAWGERIVGGTIAPLSSLGRDLRPSRQLLNRTDELQRGDKNRVAAASQDRDRGGGSGGSADRDRDRRLSSIGDRERGGGGGGNPSGFYSSRGHGRGGGGSGSGGNGGGSTFHGPSDVMTSSRFRQGRHTSFDPAAQQLRKRRNEPQQQQQLEPEEQQRREQLQRENEHQQRIARQQRQQAEASARALARLRTAGSLRALERALDTTTSELLSPRHIATAVVTYSKLIAAPQVAAAGAAGAAAGGTWKPPPPGLKERLRGALLQAASELGLRELSYCIYALSMLPKAHSLLTLDDVGYNLSEALLNRLEINLQELAVKLQKPKTSEKAHGARKGSGGGGISYGGGGGTKAETGEADGAERNLEVEILTYSCTALRRLGTLRPSVYRALAAAAAPLLGRDLSGDALPPLVLGFLEAGNPEPLFMEQLIRQSSLPYSLARTTSVFAGTILLRAAGLLGAEPRVIRPLSRRLTELLKEWLQSANAQNQSRGATAAAAATAAGSGSTAAAVEPPSSGTAEATAAAAAEAAAGGEGEGVEDALPPPPPQQQQQRVRPSTADFQIVYVLQACTAASLPPDSELVQLLITEVKRRQPGWDLLHRLMAARHLSALGVNAVAPVATAAPAEQPLQSLPPRQLPRPQQEQQTDAQAWTLISEDEVLQLLLRPGIKLTLLLTVLHGLSRLNTPACSHGNGVAAAVGGMAAAQGDEYGGRERAPAATSASHRNIMPTALSVAVQMLEAAAPLMAPRQAVQALSSLMAAGVPPPPLLLQRTEQLYKDSLTGGDAASGSGSGAASGISTMHDKRTAIEETAASGAAASMWTDAGEGPAVTTTP